MSNFKIIKIKAIKFSKLKWKIRTESIKIQQADTNVIVNGIMTTDTDNVLITKQMRTGMRKSFKIIKVILLYQCAVELFITLTKLI